MEFLATIIGILVGIGGLYVSLKKAMKKEIAEVYV